MRIHLSNNDYLLSDEFQFWIVKETQYTDKHGEKRTRQTRLTGYHSDLEHLLIDYFDRTVRRSPIEGEISELAKVIKKTRNEIRKWQKELRGMDNDQG